MTGRAALAIIAWDFIFVFVNGWFHGTLPMVVSMLRLWFIWALSVPHTFHRESGAMAWLAGCDFSFVLVGRIDGMQIDVVRAGTSGTSRA